MKTKICTNKKCFKEKLLSEFAKNTNHKDGLSYWCKNCISEYKKEHRKKNKVKIAIKAKEYYELHKNQILESQKEYREKPENKDRRNQRFKERYGSNINIRIEVSLRSRLYQSLKNNSKSHKILELLGCTIEQLKRHLQSQFTKGMTWDNYGLWHIDHIKPCAFFDFSDSKQQEICFHYTNLQPLWAEDNLKKKDKLIKAI